MMRTALRRRHSQAEIAAKIAQANDLAAQGMLQRDIVQMLGVSAMTLHRWRKASPASPAPKETAAIGYAAAEVMLTASADLSELELENSRLRQLVVNLLLEKMKLEERARNHCPSGAPHNRAAE
jgi:putative transposase